MSQNSTALPTHTLALKHLRVLADLAARDRGADLTAAYCVTPEGEKIDLLHPARSQGTRKPPAGGRREMCDEVL